MPDDVKTLLDYVLGFAGYGGRDAVAEFGEEGVEELTYKDLDAASGAAAAVITAQGVSKGDTIGIFDGPSRAWIAAAFGIIRCGAVVCPMDAQFSDDTLKHVIEDSGMRVVFARGAGAEAVQRVSDRVIVVDPFEAMSGESGNFEHPEVEPEDRAALFYTSGTTGPPKGVPLTHENLSFQVNVVSDTGLLHENDRFLMPLPLHHVYPLVVGVLAPICLGVPVILPSSLTGPELVRAMKEGRATTVIGVPRLYRALMQAVRSRAASSGFFARKAFEAAFGISGFLRKTFGFNAGRIILKSVHDRIGPDLELVASGGSLLDPELARDLEALGWNLAQGYGLTETSPLLTVNGPGQSPIESVGKAVPGMEIKVDPDAAPEGAKRDEDNFGELMARGPGVFNGYHNLPDKTAESLTEDGWFRTGDLAVIKNDGAVMLKGRVSTVLVTEGGENVQPDEIEEALDKHPVIKESGALLHEGGMAVLAVPDAGALPDADKDDPEKAVRDAVNEVSSGLASYKRPQTVAVSSKPLPRTRLGKIRRHLLADRFKEALEGRDSAKAGPMPVGEMSPENRKLVTSDPASRVWDYLAERYSDRSISPETGISLDLGVDSLEWLNMTMEIQDRAGVVLKEEDLGPIETVRDLLAKVQKRAESGYDEQGVDPVDNPDEALGKERMHWLDPLSPGMRAVRNLCYWLLFFLMRLFFRLDVKGREKLPRGGFVLAPNHLSYMDPLAIVASLDLNTLDNLFWAGWSGAAYHNKFLGFFSRLGQTIPIEQSKGPMSSLAVGAAVIKRERILGWFPEGRRSQSGELMEFKRGLGMILSKRPADVVPTAIIGTRDALKPGTAVIRPARIRVVFGDPVHSDTLESEGDGESKAERIVSGLRKREAKLLRSVS